MKPLKRYLVVETVAYEVLAYDGPEAARLVRDNPGRDCWATDTLDRRVVEIEDVDPPELRYMGAC